MDEQRKNNENHFVGTFNDSYVNDSSIPFNALTYQSSSCNFSFKWEDEQGTDQEVKKEINGICNDSVEVGDVRIQSNSNDMSFVFEEMKVTNCYSESECVIEKENSGNDSEQDPLLLNEEDLYRKIILERNSASYFPSKIKKEKPGNDSEQDPLLLNEVDLSTKVILKRIDSSSSFSLKIRNEEPASDSSCRTECSCYIPRDRKGPVVVYPRRDAAVYDHSDHILDSLSPRNTYSIFNNLSTIREKKLHFEFFDTSFYVAK